MKNPEYEVRAVKSLSNLKSYVPIDLSTCRVRCSWTAHIYSASGSAENQSGQPVAKINDVSTQELIANLNERYFKEENSRASEVIYAEPFGSARSKIFPKADRVEETKPERRRAASALDALAEED